MSNIVHPPGSTAAQSNADVGGKEIEYPQAAASDTTQAVHMPVCGQPESLGETVETLTAHCDAFKSTVAPFDVRDVEGLINSLNADLDEILNNERTKQ